MKKPNWVCSNCSMWSSRKSSVKRHIQNVHRGNSNIVSFIDYMAGRKSGFYFPSPRPTYGRDRSTATTTVTVMDTFKDELLKGFASKAVNEALSSSPIQNQQFDFQGFGSNGVPYFYPGQSYFEPFHIIPRPEDIFGFKIYICKKCSAILPVIVSFNEGKEGGSKIGWSGCCSSAALKEIDRSSFKDNNHLQQIQDKLKYCVKTWTGNKPMLTAIKIPESVHGTSIKLLVKDDKQSISLEYSSKKISELDIDDENHWAPRCVRAGTTALSDDDLVDFLNKTGNATFGFLIVKTEKFKGIFLMAILNNIVAGRLRLV